MGEVQRLSARPGANPAGKETKGGATISMRKRAGGRAKFGTFASNSAPYRLHGTDVLTGADKLFL